MLRFLVYLAIAVGLAYCGATVKLGKRTFFQHIQAIWHTEEAQELKDGVKDTAGPTVDKIKRGVKAGFEAAEGSGSGHAHGSGAAPTTP